MNTKVIDASALAAVLFDEPESDLIVPRIENAALIAPSLLFYEITNVCAIKLRRYPKEQGRILLAMDELQRFDIQTFEVVYKAVVAVAESHKLSGYDACYLWLAHAHDADLVTLDQQLIAAASRPR